MPFAHSFVRFMFLQWWDTARDLDSTAYHQRLLLEGTAATSTLTLDRADGHPQLEGERGGGLVVHNAASHVGEIGFLANQRYPVGKLLEELPATGVMVDLHKRVGEDYTLAHKGLRNPFAPYYLSDMLGDVRAHLEAHPDGRPLMVIFEQSEEAMPSAPSRQECAHFEQVVNASLGGLVQDAGEFRRTGRAVVFPGNNCSNHSTVFSSNSWLRPYGVARLEGANFSDCTGAGRPMKLVPHHLYYAEETGVFLSGPGTRPETLEALEALGGHPMTQKAVEGASRCGAAGFTLDYLGTPFHPPEDLTRMTSMFWHVPVPGVCQVTHTEGMQCGDDSAPWPAFCTNGTHFNVTGHPIVWANASAQCQAEMGGGWRFTHPHSMKEFYDLAAELPDAGRAHVNVSFAEAAGGHGLVMHADGKTQHSFPTLSRDGAAERAPVPEEWWGPFPIIPSIGPRVVESMGPDALAFGAAIVAVSWAGRRTKDYCLQGEKEHPSLPRARSAPSAVGDMTAHAMSFGLQSLESQLFFGGYGTAHQAKESYSSAREAGSGRCMATMRAGAAGVGHALHGGACFYLNPVAVQAVCGAVRGVMTVPQGMKRSCSIGRGISEGVRAAGRQFVQGLPGYAALLTSRDQLERRWNDAEERKAAQWKQVPGEKTEAAFYAWQEMEILRENEKVFLAGSCDAFVKQEALVHKMASLSPDDSTRERLEQDRKCLHTDFVDFCHWVEDQRSLWSRQSQWEHYQHIAEKDPPNVPGHLQHYWDEFVRVVNDVRMGGEFQSVGEGMRDYQCGEGYDKAIGYRQEIIKRGLVKEIPIISGRDIEEAQSFDDSPLPPACEPILKRAPIEYAKMGVPLRFRYTAIQAAEKRIEARLGEQQQEPLTQEEQHHEPRPSLVLPEGHPLPVSLGKSLDATPSTRAGSTPSRLPFTPSSRMSSISPGERSDIEQGFAPTSSWQDAVSSPLRGDASPARG